MTGEFRARTWPHSAARPGPLQSPGDGRAFAACGCRAADPGPRPLLVMTSRRLDPAAQLPRLLGAQGDEAEARPQLRARAGVVHPQQVRADVDRDRPLIM